MTQTFIPGKDAALEDSIARFQQKLTDLGFNIEEASWLNPVPHVWSVHIRDKDCALCFTNGKGATKKAALASALGEYFERLSTNYFFADFWLGETIANGPFVHYPNEKWFPLTENDELPEGILDARLRAFYDPENELTASMLIDLQSGNEDRGICALPFTRQSDEQTVYIPMNIVGNLYVSNGMSAGNTRNEARVQGLSEVFERHIKNRIIAESISLPEIPADVLARYPGVVESIAKLEAEGFPIFAYDGSLGAGGVELHLTGDANDYVGKGMAGGLLAIRPPVGSAFRSHEASIIGNTCLYGATGGRLYAAGRAGERFAVRNSGAITVVEGIGDNGCEYMTGGIVCVLGKTGVNFGAGMTGGFAYVLDEDGDFRKRVNPELVEVLDVDSLAIHEEHLRGLITEHVQLTGSQRGEEILANWPAFSAKFALVKPKSSDVKALLGHRSRSAAELRVQAQ